MISDVFLLFIWTIGDDVGPRWGKMKNWRFCGYGNFGDKNHRVHLLTE